MKKIKSNKGASMILALAIVLGVGLVSITLFHTTMQMVQNVNHKKESEKVEILVTSMAEVVQSEIENKDSSMTRYLNQNIGKSIHKGKQNEVKLSNLSNTKLDGIQSRCTLSFYYTSNENDDANQRVLYVKVEMSYKKQKAYKNLSFAYDGTNWKYLKENVI